MVLYWFSIELILVCTKDQPNYSYMYVVSNSLRWSKSTPSFKVYCPSKISSIHYMRSLINMTSISGMLSMTYFGKFPKSSIGIEYTLQNLKDISRYNSIRLGVDIDRPSLFNQCIGTYIHYIHEMK